MVLLAGYFCEQCRLRMGLAQVILSEATRARLLAWPWPGNVRELEHAIHRAVVLARATQAGNDIVLQPRHFQLAGEAPALPSVSPQPAAEAVSLREATEAFQREAIASALAANGWGSMSPTCTGWRSVWGLKDPGLIKVLQVNRADQLAVFIHHRSGADFVLHQALLGFYRAAFRLQSNAVAGHRLADDIL